MRKDGLHQGSFNSDEFKIVNSQPRGDLRSWENTVIHMEGLDHWMIFLVVEKLYGSDQFILVRDFVRNFDVMIDLNNGLIRIRNPGRNYVKQLLSKIITDKNKLPIF